MNDTFRYNRSLLGKKKSAREIYKEEIKNRSGNFSNQNIDYVRERVAERLKQNKTKNIFARVAAMLVLAFIIFGTIWLVLNIKFTVKRKGKYKDKSSLFNQVIYPQSNGLELKIDYFIQGPRAAETFLKAGRKHQNSESYYESGQQFRSALYYYDTLITEVYFFKSGDTIKSFPVFDDNKVHSIRLLDKSGLKQIQFDFWDGKIIQDTYREIDVNVQQR